jgi:hypothetical protein
MNNQFMKSILTVGAGWLKGRSLCLLLENGILVDAVYEADAAMISAAR